MGERPSARYLNEMGNGAEERLQVKTAGTVWEAWDFTEIHRIFDLDAPGNMPVTRRTRKPAESNSAWFRAFRVKAEAG